MYLDDVNAKLKSRCEKLIDTKKMIEKSKADLDNNSNDFSSKLMYKQFKDIYDTDLKELEECMIIQCSACKNYMIKLDAFYYESLNKSEFKDICEPIVYIAFCSKECQYPKYDKNYIDSCVNKASENLKGINIDE